MGLEMVETPRCGDVYGRMMIRPYLVCVKISWQLRIMLFEADSVTPAQAGVQKTSGVSWIPACAGMTARAPWWAGWWIRMQMP